MTKEKILHYLETINSELTDAYNTAPDTSETSDTLYYIDSARDLIDELTNNIENNVTISEKEEHDFNEAINNELMGPDGLPLNFPYHINDGEGRLKGNN
tara:strand:+ start:1674 stop:1970 length:297 start_codon:yes stop_codon:yes gene_type:complete